MKKYFSDCKTEPQVKREYRKLSHAHHPDKPGGDKETFQEIEKQKTQALRRIAVSEGKEESYYQDILINKGFMEGINIIDKELENQGVKGNNFLDIFMAVAKIFETPKKNMKDKSPKMLPNKG